MQQQKFNKELLGEELIGWLTKKLYFFEQYQDLFRINHIDAISFLSLDYKRLKEMGVKPVGHQLRIIKLINIKKKKYQIQN